MSDSINKPSNLPFFGPAADGAARNAPLEHGSPASTPDPAASGAADGHYGPPSDCSPPKATEVTNLDLQTSGGALSHYSVGFYNETSDSTGHDHHVCQREVEVTASGADQALADAIVQFEEQEEVSTWRDRANSIECTQNGRRRKLQVKS